MGHTELRELRDDDLDAVFLVLSDSAAVRVAAFTADDPDDRDAFDVWVAERRGSDDVSLWTVTEDGGFAGLAAGFAVGDDREVSLWLAHHARGRGVGIEALRQLISREAERPLYARVAAGNEPAIGVLRHCGFAEFSRDTVYAPGTGGQVEEVLFALVPALDGM